MRQIIVIHGGNTFLNYEDYVRSLQAREIDFEDYISQRQDWKRNLQEALGASFQVVLLQMPNKQNTRYSEWEIWFQKFVPFFEADALFIGHSLGGIFLVKYLSMHALPQKVSSLFLIAAPFKDVQGLSLADFSLPSSLDSVQKQCKAIAIYHSKDDVVVPYRAAEQYKEALSSAVLRTFSNRGHFNDETFPELVENIRNLSQNN